MDLLLVRHRCSDAERFEQQRGLLSRPRHPRVWDVDADAVAPQVVNNLEGGHTRVFAAPFPARGWCEIVGHRSHLHAAKGPGRGVPSAVRTRSYGSKVSYLPTNRRRSSLLNRVGADGWELADREERPERGDGPGYWDPSRTVTIYTFKNPVPG
jgi:hypothetical protein